MRRPSISVVIPTHNRGAMARAAVASVLAQTRPADEIIVVDDASTDGTPALLADLAADVRVVRVADNAERGAARNLGARLSSGELLAFLDSDDVWDASKLERQLQWAGSAVPSVTGVRILDEDGVDTGRTYVPALGAADEILTGNPYLGGPSSLVLPRALFDAVGGFPEARELQTSEDWLLFNKLARAGQAPTVVPEALVGYRRHTASSSESPAGVARSIWASCDWLDAEGYGDERIVSARRARQAGMIAEGFIAQRRWRPAVRWATRTATRGPLPVRLRASARICRAAAARLLP